MWQLWLPLVVIFDRLFLEHVIAVVGFSIEKYPNHTTENPTKLQNKITNNVYLFAEILPIPRNAPRKRDGTSPACQRWSNHTSTVLEDIQASLSAAVQHLLRVLRHSVHLSGRSLGHCPVGSEFRGRFEDVRQRSVLPYVQRVCNAGQYDHVVCAVCKWILICI